MIGIAVALLIAGYAVAWSGFGKLVSGGNPLYNLSNAFGLTSHVPPPASPQEATPSNPYVTAGYSTGPGGSSTNPVAAAVGASGAPVQVT